MKRSIVLNALFFGAALVFGASTLAQDAADAPQLAKKTLRLNDAANLRPVEPTRVSPHGRGFVEENGVYVCGAGDATDETFGVARRFELNQTTATPVVATGWSRAEGVSGALDSGYSLYIDVEYVDGSTLWGQAAPFPAGDADWSQERVEIFPTLPIKALTFYGLFRERSGKASFKDFQFFEARLPEGFALFDGVPVATSSSDGAANGGIALRDVANDGDFLAIDADAAASPDGAQVDGVRVRVETAIDAENGATAEKIVRLENLTGADRALTFVDSVAFSDVFADGAPTDAAIYWLDDPRRVRRIDAKNEYLNANGVADVANGRLSRYPIGGIASAPTSDAESGAAFGFAIDPDYPAFYRIGACGATRELYIAFDVALTPEKPVAEFRFRTLADRPARVEDAFRGLFEGYRRAYPNAFVVRAPRQGNWIPFAKTSEVPNWQDFGFVFKEGDNETDWDDANGIVTFRYTEPMTWWQALPKDAPETLEAAVAAAEKLAAEGDRAAQALATSGIRGKSGDLRGLFLDTPWCDGVVWSVNDAPGLVELAKNGKLGDAKTSDGTPYPAGFELKWSDEIADSLYPPAPATLPATRDEFENAEATPGLDGEYVDSSEGYVTSILDFDRAHFAGMTTPLVFDAKTKKPAIYRGLVAFEYVRKIAADVHARAKLAMANSTPDQFFWLVPQLDVVGTETNWNWNGRWTPTSDADLLYRRALCGGKPYCFLMNTDFDVFSPEMIEKYMKRSLAYGMFPSFFSADASTKQYFTTPPLYERDRELFKKYLPLCKAVAEAGWNPSTGARSNDATIYVESFGGAQDVDVNASQLVYFTVFNDSQDEKSFEIAFDAEFSEFGGATELTTGEKVEIDDGKIVGEIGPEDVRVFRLNRSRP